MKHLALLPCLLVALGTTAVQRGIPDPGSPLPEYTKRNDVAISAIKHKGASATAIAFGTDAPWPNLFFAAPSPWDWEAYAGIRVGLFNPGKTAVTVSLRVDNEGANGTDHCNTKQQLLPPGEARELVLYFNTPDRERFWGMRGIPVRGPMGTGAPLDLSVITGWQLFLNRPDAHHTIYLTSIELFGEGGDLAEKVPFPFIDAYGQYTHQDWPAKIHRDEELRQAYEEERAARTQDVWSDRDTYGGWLEGPQLEATGWFRTTKVDGVWWLVTPDGHLFFSAGADCVGTWSRTFVEGREDWFAWLPPENDPLFKGAYGYAKGAHSMADTINGEGKTFGFYAANLMRLHGEDWQAAWRENTLARLRSWGFNTIGNWSAWDVMEDGDLPFVVPLGISGVRPIEAATGYWAKMMDVYDPSFAEAVARMAQKGTAKWRDNPRCIGYFVDNELAWGGVINGVLGSGPDQPARQAFLEHLQARYENIGGLNAAWETGFPDWAAIAAPESRTAAATRDLDGFLRAFAATYYATIKDALAEHAPDQLYLGSRFAVAPEPVVQACAEHADVVSINVYAPKLDQNRAALFSSLEKPVIIGEFHFGATDRGMFHPGLVPVASQATRGEAYVRYVRSMLEHPAVVGCHWFQYVDEPTTGRYFDGENYNIGLVDITDQPYPHLVRAATAVHRDLYRFRTREVDAGDALVDDS